MFQPSTCAWEIQLSPVDMSTFQKKKMSNSRHVFFHKSGYTCLSHFVANFAVQDAYTYMHAHKQTIADTPVCADARTDPVQILLKDVGIDHLCTF